jgi:hypothetical protein
VSKRINTASAYINDAKPIRHMLQWSQQEHNP